MLTPPWPDQAVSEGDARWADAAWELYERTTKKSRPTADRASVVDALEGNRDSLVWLLHRIGCSPLAKVVAVGVDDPDAQSVSALSVGDRLMVDANHGCVTVDAIADGDPVEVNGIEKDTYRIRWSSDEANVSVPDSTWLGEWVIRGDETGNGFRLAEPF